MDIKRMKSTFPLAENAAKQQRFAFEQLPITSMFKANQALKNPVSMLPQYTRKRKEYEKFEYISSDLERQQQYMMYYSANMESGSSGRGGRNCDTTFTSLSELQKFRLSHANDCFSRHRQLDLKMDRIIKDGDNNGAGANVCVNLQQSPTPSKRQSITMPYAMRQRLLRLQLDAEEAASFPERRRKIQQRM